MSYLVELVYVSDGHHSPYGHAEEKTPQLIEWRDRLERSHRDVKCGKATCCIREVGSDV